MKKLLVIILAVISITIVIFLYALTHAKLYDMGTRGNNATLLSAEYEKGKDKCSFDFDSTGATIYTGTFEKQSVLMNKKYSICGDTILINGKISDLMPYVNTNKLLVSNNRLLFHLDSTKKYDTAYVAKIWLNRIENNQH